MISLVYVGQDSTFQDKIINAGQKSTLPFQLMQQDGVVFLLYNDDIKTNVASIELLTAEAINMVLGTTYTENDFKKVRAPGSLKPVAIANAKPVDSVEIDLSKISSSQQQYYLALAATDPTNIIYNKATNSILLKSTSTLIDRTPVARESSEVKIDVTDASDMVSVKTTKQASEPQLDATSLMITDDQLDEISSATDEPVGSGDVRDVTSGSILSTIALTALGVTGAIIVGLYLTGIIQDWAAKKVRKGSRNAILNKLALAGSLKHIKFKGHVIKQVDDGEERWIDSTEVYNILRIYPLAFYDDTLFLTNDYDSYPRHMKIKINSNVFYVYGVQITLGVKELLCMNEDGENITLRLPTVDEAARYYGIED